MDLLNKRGVAPVNSYTISFRQSYNVSQGLNTIYLNNKTLFPINSVIFYESKNAKITLSASNNQQSDLIWDTTSNLLKKVDADGYYKFNFKVLIDNYVYEDSVPINHVYDSPNVYQISVHVNDISCSSLSKQATIKKGKYEKMRKNKF